MEIPDAWAPLLVSAVRDGLLYNEGLLTSRTIRNRADHEEHVMQLSQLLEYLREQYKAVECEAGIPLDKLLGGGGEGRSDAAKAGTLLLAVLCSTSSSGKTEDGTGRCRIRRTASTSRFPDVAMSGGRGAWLRCSRVRRLE